MSLGKESCASLENVQVSVVVIAHNEEAHIAAAVRSVQHQTHALVDIVVVDHGSEDSTRDIVADLAADDPRIRLIALDTNDGGPGRPLNEGLRQARGDWITILGGDDELEPTACQDMLEFALRENLDVVLGRAQRINVDTTGLATTWHGGLFRETRTVRSVAELPGLLFDTISASKLFRAEFLRDRTIEFPESITYEDQPFTFDVYDQADGIGILAKDVYRWMVRTSGAHRSLTNSRFRIENLNDRIVANRMVDERITTAKHPELRIHKVDKFFRHDLKLYIQELHEYDDAYRASAFKIIGEYLRGLPWDELHDLVPAFRFAAGSLLLGDLTGAQAAFRFLRDPHSIDVRFTSVDDRTFWRDPGEDPLAQDLLDTACLKLNQVPFDAYPLRFALTELSHSPDGLNVRVEVQDPQGISGRFQLTGAQFEFAPIGGGRGLPLVQTGGLLPRRKPPRPSVVMPLIADSDGQYRGEGLLRLPSEVFRKLDRRVRWELRWSVTESQGSINRGQVSPLLIPADALQAQWTVIPSRSWFSNDAHILQMVSKGGKVLIRQKTQPGTFADLRERKLRALKKSQRLRRGVRKAIDSARTTRKRLRHYRNIAVFRAGAIMPRRRHLVVFEAYEGKLYGDSPRVLSEHLAKSRPELTQLWSYSRHSVRDSLPAHVDSVRRGSVRYFYLLARAGYWVDNFGMPRDLAKPRGTTYVQSWHGTPLKKLFFAAPKVQAMPDDRKRQYQRMVNRWDYVISQSPYFTEVMGESTRTTATFLETGTPRADALLALDPAQTRAEVCERLDVEETRTTVLYAPTYREQGKDSAAFRGLNWEQIISANDADFCYLLRSHYFRKGRQIPPTQATALRDVSNYQPLEELLQASDVLITDHSSVMFDYAILNKPVIFYVPDLEYYENTSPQTYLSLPDIAPGPLVTNEAELLDELSRLDTWQERYGDQLTAFRARFLPWDDGTAAERVVSTVWRAP